MWSWFPYINLVLALIAAALWYVFPQLMVWPLLIGCLPWLLRLGHEGRWRWRTPFDWPLLLFLLMGLISVWAAYDRGAAWAKLWTIVAGILLFYALAAFFLPGAEEAPGPVRAAPAWILAAFGAVVSLYFVATHDWEAFAVKVATLNSLGRSLQGVLPDLPGHRLHPNVVGGILAMMAPFGGAVSWRAARRGRWLQAIAGLFLLGTMLLGLLLSVSRGAWLALGAAVGLAALWGLAGVIAGRLSSRRRLLFLSALALLALVGAIVLMMQGEMVQSALANLPALAGGLNRLDLYRSSLILAQDYPFIGSGLGGFMMLYSAYAYLIHVGFIIHAHNIYLDVAIEQGLPALLALVWMWALFGLSLWRDAAGGRLRPWLGAAALSLTTILLHGLLEDALYGSRAVMLLFVPLAFSVPFAQRAAVSAGRRRWVALGLIAALVMVVAVIWQRPLRSLAASNIAAVQQSRAELSLYQWPEWSVQDELRRQMDLSGPRAGFERALVLNAGNATANRRLGQIALSSGEYERALAYLEVAYAQRPWDNATRQLLGEALLANGRAEEGAALWRTVNNAQQQLELRAFWYRSIGDAEREAQMRAAIPE